MRLRRRSVPRLHQSRQDRLMDALDAGFGCFTCLPWLILLGMGLIVVGGWLLIVNPVAFVGLLIGVGLFFQIPAVKKWLNTPIHWS